MAITRPEFQLRVNAQGTRTLPGVTGTANIGFDTGLTSMVTTGTPVAFCWRVEGGSGAAAVLDLATGLPTVDVAGTPGVTTATAVGTASSDGNVNVVITESPYAAANKTLNVAVTSGDTASTWAGKVRAALAADTVVSTYYTISGTTTSIVLTDKIANNDNPNIALINGSPNPGITPDSFSTDTTTGVAYVTNSAKDFEGQALPENILFHTIAIKVEAGGSATVSGFEGASFLVPLVAPETGDIYAVPYTGYTHDSLQTTGEITVGINNPGTVVEVYVYGATVA